MKEINTYRKAFGKFLTGLRAEAGLTQGDVAKLLDYSTPQFISNVERGICTTPIHVMVGMAKIYGVSVDSILKAYSTMQAGLLRNQVAKIVVPKKVIEGAASRRRVRAKEMHA